jgi:hypothetical protein
VVRAGPALAVFRVPPDLDDAALEVGFDAGLEAGAFVAPARDPVDLAERDRFPEAFGVVDVDDDLAAAARPDRDDVGFDSVAVRPRDEDDFESPDAESAGFVDADFDRDDVDAVDVDVPVFDAPVFEVDDFVGDDFDADDFDAGDLAGDDLADDDFDAGDLAGDDLAGDDFDAGDLAGDDLAGDDLAGDDFAVEDRDAVPLAEDFAAVPVEPVDLVPERADSWDEPDSFALVDRDRDDVPSAPESAVVERRREVPLLSEDLDAFGAPSAEAPERVLPPVDPL